MGVMQIEEIERLCADLESDRVERKSAFGNGEPIREAICALANDLPDHRQPGVVFVGIRDDGTCAGLPITDELLKRLSGIMDLGPNLGAINRAALIAADYVVVPLSPDLFSLQGLRNLGPKLRTWRGDWFKRREASQKLDFELPPGSIQPVGYLVQQHSVRLDRPVKAYEKWMDRIPTVYRDAVLDTAGENSPPVKTDPNCLAQLKHYRSLIPMAQESHKPIFHLKPADGAMGSHFQAAQDVRRDFDLLAREIANRCNLSMSAPAAPSQAPLFTPTSSSSATRS